MFACTVHDKQMGHINQVGHLSKAPLNLLEIHQIGSVDTSESKQQNSNQRWHLWHPDQKLLGLSHFRWLSHSPVVDCTGGGAKYLICQAISPPPRPPHINNSLDHPLNEGMYLGFKKTQGGGVLPYLCMAGRFCSDDLRFWDFQSDWVPILYLNTIRLTPLCAEKNWFVSITFSSRDTRT